MGQLNVFISVGGTATETQEIFVSAIENRLRSENLIPNTVGRNKFSADSPLKTVNELMNDCSGTIIVALERTYFPNGLEKRGGEKETKLTETKFATPWNQIEAAMAYSKGQPLMLIIEEGLKSEGLLEKGYDWYVMWVKPDKSSLSSTEFNGVLSSWKNKVELYNTNKTKLVSGKTEINPADLTVGELIKNLKTSQLWAVLVGLVGLIVGAFAIGQHFAK
ncbi:MAG: hypothetical protein IPO01_13875 [Chitinophagaceae bacterium]|nr:hypothetical protein [Chitinophagaceae bacterium]MBK7306238.1 hypothetical protein [Chitinophagaceae bacterium]MBK8787253.1 hypothetical protein [Chitinophagaceae bacterium]MBK9486241.1 hypothetical protein [Chitinophagaceae bacterium]MBL0201202.1 hypothetical protein [Chitinophagaceae bacterium]